MNQLISSLISNKFEGGILPPHRGPTATPDPINRQTLRHKSAVAGGCGPGRQPGQCRHPRRNGPHSNCWLGLQTCPNRTVIGINREIQPMNPAWSIIDQHISILAAILRFQLCRFDQIATFEFFISFCLFICMYFFFQSIFLPMSRIIGIGNWQPWREEAGGGVAEVKGAYWCRTRRPCQHPLLAGSLNSGR